MDILRFDGQKGPIRDFTVCSIRCMYRSELPMDSDGTYAKMHKFQHPKSGSP